VCHKKRRFYLFSRREPADDAAEASAAAAAAGGDDDVAAALAAGGTGRDVYNEKPDAEEIASAQVAEAQRFVGSEVVLRTTAGDIYIKVFGAQCPKTAENFCTLSKNGYYDGLLIHRVIKGFMLQMGDPEGDGTGGESIWGGEFEDEIHRDLRHDRPYTVSMANAGPGTNGSQFFITTVPTPWLDGKHTVFGRVTRGMDVCQQIEACKTDKYDKPTPDIKIVNVDVVGA